MAGPEFDPLRAYVDRPTPRANPWSDDTTEPTPETCPVGPVVIGVLPSQALNKQYHTHDTEFVQTARKGITLCFLWVELSFCLFLISCSFFLGIDHSRCSGLMTVLVPNPFGWVRRDIYSSWKL